MSKVELYFFGTLAILGGLIQFWTSGHWQEYKDQLTPTETVGEFVFILGQNVGELCYLACVQRLFLDQRVMWYVIGLWFDLCFLDLVYNIWFDPFEKALGKSEIVAALCILFLIRLGWRSKIYLKHDTTETE